VCHLGHSVCARLSSVALFDVRFVLMRAPLAVIVCWALSAAAGQALHVDAPERTARRETPSHLETVLVVPELKFIFCYIPKNACTQFNKMMDVMNGMVPGGGWHHQLSSATRAFGWSQEHVKKLFRDKSWTKAVFLRDPLERLVSAWRNKCRHGAEECKRLGGCPNCIDGDFEAAVGKLQRTEDEHWIKQSRFGGGLPSFIGDYDFVGHTSKNFSDMHAQVVTMLRLALAQNSDKSRAIFQAIPGHNCSGHANQVLCISTWLADTYLTPSEDSDMEETFFAGYRDTHQPGPARTVRDPYDAEDLTNVFFPAGHSSAVNPSGTADGAGENTFRTATLRKAVLYYAEDYEGLPGLSLPQWALDMEPSWTGLEDWYSGLDHRGESSA